MFMLTPPIVDMFRVAAMESGDPCGVESLYVKDEDVGCVGVVVGMESF